MRGDNSSYIRTYTGGQFWPLDPHIDDVVLEDIAHSLAHQCRWTGHSKEFYSVAQHCVLVSEFLQKLNRPILVQLEGLMHDASEAYLTDLARPIKHAPGLGDAYRKAEKKVELVLAEKFGLPKEMSPIVKEVDSRLLMTEKRDLMEGDWVETHADGLLPIPDLHIDPWSPQKAEEEFLNRFHLLTSPNTFTTGEYARQISMGRHAALARLKKLESRGIVERCLVKQNQGGIVRPNVLGWRFLQSNTKGTLSETNSGRVSVDAEEDSSVDASHFASASNSQR